MKNERNCAVAVVLLALVFGAGPVLAEKASSGTTDSERIINVEELKAALNEATSPISKRIKESQLIEKFDAVNNLLQQKDADKKLLLNALEDLQDEMVQFGERWSELTDPLWRGQDAIAGTIEKVTLLLARSGTGEPSEKVKDSLKNYDKRLSSLASAIKGEKNEERKRRLKMVFANVLSLKALTERAGTIDLGPAQQAVYVQIIESLSNLEMALTNSTFQVERVRIVLASQADFVGTYTDILAGLIESEELAKVFADMNSAGNGIGLLAGDLGVLNGKLEGFTTHMNALAERLSLNIDAQASNMATVPDIDEQEVERMIEEYSSKKSK
jgi:hypothetical protein